MFMTKQKKITVGVICLFCAVLLIAGAPLFIRVYLKNQITFTVKDTLADGQGKEATVILLGGQSNASGSSRDDYLQQKSIPEKYAEYQNGYDNVYINYLAGGRCSEGFVKCSVLQGEHEGYFGPELGLAERLHEAYPDETFFIIKCAWGGTNLYEQWRSPSAQGETGELYLQFVAYVKASLAYLEKKDYDITVKGMCWMQGESDSCTAEAAADYGIYLADFIKDIRAEFKCYAPQEGMAFADAYIANDPSFWVHCGLVNQAKRTVADRSPMNVIVDTVAAGLTRSEEPEGTPDLAHYDALSEIKLGHLFADALAPFLT
ncbi:MAG: sialate O-acetylesterase [Ruminococcaceae bacterium]|nr:sialate O-acetylesterase [Oscillospiraceae bacterium]